MNPDLEAWLDEQEARGFLDIEDIGNVLLAAWDEEDRVIMDALEIWVSDDEQ